MSIFCDNIQLEQYQEKQLLKVINEAYFGRTTGIMRCFDAFCDFRRKYVGDGIFHSVGISNINADHDKDLKRFISEMEREFGLESFSFVPVNSVRQNAFTYSILFSTHLDPKKTIEVSKSGYKFKPEVRMSIIVCVLTGLLFNSEYTDEEAFAIILHEIGHNFQEYLNGNVQQLTNVNRVLFVLSSFIDICNGKIFNVAIGTLISTSLIHRAISELFNRLTEEDKNNLYSYLNFIQGIVRLPKQIIKSIICIPILPIKMLLYSGKALLSALVHPFKSAQMYLGEKMADNFTSYYGFGEAQATALEKMEREHFGSFVQLIQDCPLIGHIYNFALLPGDILVTLADEHPALPVRQKEILNSMKYDLNDPNLSPKLRKSLKKEIDEYQKTVNSIYEKNSKLSNPRFFKYVLDNAIYRSKHGGLKSSINNLLFGDVSKEADIRTNIIRNAKII